METLRNKLMDVDADLEKLNTVFNMIGSMLDLEMVKATDSSVKNLKENHKDLADLYAIGGDYFHNIRKTVQEVVA